MEKGLAKVLGTLNWMLWCQYWQAVDLKTLSGVATSATCWDGARIRSIRRNLCAI